MWLKGRHSSPHSIYGYMVGRLKGRHSSPHCIYGYMWGDSRVDTAAHIVFIDIWWDD